MGGALLAMDGLRRGGKLGLAETTAGGALIGFKYGGPIGAAIGAASRARSPGTIRLFVKGAQEKAREKIKAHVRRRYLRQGRAEADRRYGEAGVRRQPRHGDPDASRSATWSNCTR